MHYFSYCCTPVPHKWTLNTVTHPWTNHRPATSAVWKGSWMKSDWLAGLDAVEEMVFCCRGLEDSSVQMLDWSSTLISSKHAGETDCHITRRIGKCHQTPLENCKIYRKYLFVHKWRKLLFTHTSKQTQRKISISEFIVKFKAKNDSVSISALDIPLIIPSLSTHSMKPSEPANKNTQRTAAANKLFSAVSVQCWPEVSYNMLMPTAPN